MDHFILDTSSGTALRPQCTRVVSALRADAFTVLFAWLILAWPARPVAAAPPDPQSHDPRIRPPIRAWFQPPFLDTMPSLYAHMTLVTSLTDAKSADYWTKHGVVALRWCFGPTSEYSGGRAAYYCGQCDPTIDGKVCFAGVGIDEWDPGQKRYAAEKDMAARGFRAARKKWPKNLMVCWVTQPDETFLGLLRDGTFDLAIIEGYTFIPDVGGLTMDAVCGRCEIVKKAGLLDRTIVCLGYLSATPDKSGRAMTIGQIERNVRLIKEKYPEMPGVAFYGFPDDSPQTRQLIRQTDELSGRLYPATIRPKP